jgi:hypothetical protein
MKKIVMIMIAGCTLLFTACTKSGPQGPEGPQGNANVKGSDPFNVTSWTLNTAENAYEASFNDVDVTASVAARGDVEIFLQHSDGTWSNLPDVYNGTIFYSRFSEGGFDIYYGDVDGTTPAFPTGTWTFRSVVIAPSLRQSHPNTNWKNYNEAMAAINETKAAAATAGSTN